MAQLLEASGDYRVLRRLRRQTAQPSALRGETTRLGIVLDVETTGLDPATDEIIELAMVPFTYALDGRVLAVHEPFERLRQPSSPISPEITRITGIDDAMVAGKTIDADEVATFAAPAALIIAHNAGFDRRFAERLSEVFTTKAWACSMSQVPWVEEGCAGAKLTYIAADLGLFYDGHRAAHDCHATLEVLTRPLPTSGETGLSKLLAAARTPAWRIWAEGSPFEFKDALKARGYRWNPEGAGGPKSWYIDVADHDRAAEIDYLCKEVFLADVNIPVRQLSVYDRFSDRI